jgi:methylphosphotriester-DNA--protein-cysteine methyltransferase
MNNFKTMWLHHQLTGAKIRKLLRAEQIVFAGNTKLKIYGLLTCSSGKRMKKESRVFFASETAALELGYRPCGHCLKKSYILWKNYISKKQVDCRTKATQF